MRSAKPVTQRFPNDFIARQRLRRTVLLREKKAFSTPLTYGTLRPVILLPEETDPNDTQTLRMILSHELEHVRRFDALRKLSLALCAAVHWFNPLCWVLFSLAARDLEVACDESVIRRLGLTARRDYALALLKAEERRSLSPFASCFAKNHLEFRVRSVMNMKKRSVLMTVVVLTLTICLFCLFATSASASGTAEKIADNAYVFRDLREPYTETAVHPIGEDLSIIEEIEYPADVFVIFSQKSEAVHETVRLSECIDGSAPSVYPIEIVRTYSYDYYDIHRNTICTATIDISAVFYGNGNAKITSATASFEGLLSEHFSQSCAVGEEETVLTLRFCDTGIVIVFEALDDLFA